MGNASYIRILKGKHTLETVECYDWRILKWRDYPDEFTNKIRWNCAEKIEIDSSGIFVIDTSGWIHSGRSFGETTFLTKSEAEQALRKAKEETND